MSLYSHSHIISKYCKMNTYYNLIACLHCLNTFRVPLSNDISTSNRPIMHHHHLTLIPLYKVGFYLLTFLLHVVILFHTTHSLYVFLSRPLPAAPLTLFPLTSFWYASISYLLFTWYFQTTTPKPLCHKCLFLNISFTCPLLSLQIGRYTDRNIWCSTVMA